MPPIISSSVIPFFPCLQSFSASGFFPVSQFFTSGDQSIGASASASASVLPMNTQEWSPLGGTGWISLQSRGFSSLLQHHRSKASILWCSVFFIVQLSHPYKATGKTIALTRWTFIGKVMYLLLNMLSRLVITFLPRSKCSLISCSVNLWSNFLLMGGAVFPPCCLIWGKTMVEVMKISFFKMSRACSAALSAWPWSRPPLTHVSDGDSWSPLASLGQLLLGSLLLSPESWCI